VHNIFSLFVPDSAIEPEACVETARAKGNTGPKFSRRKSMIFSRKRTQRGQGMTEYIIIVALIAIAAIAVYQFFGNTVRSQTAAIANELAGNDGTQAKNDAQAAATTAATEANTKRNLDTYTGNAAR
jgi:type IV pilus assembly protein PilA